MIKDRNFIFTGIQAWDIPIGSNAKNIATEVAKHNKVLYVNPPLDRGTYLRNRNNPSIRKMVETIRGTRPEIEEVSENLYVFTPRVVLNSINRIPVSFIYRFLLKRNAKRFAHEVKRAMIHLGMADPIVITDSDMFRSLQLKEVLKPETFCYYSRDNLQAVAYWHKHGKYVEPEIMVKADVIFSNSEYLATIARKYNFNAENVGQGCDVSAFDASKKYMMPEDLTIVPGIKIGYIGALNSLRLDPQILSVIASANPAWHVVLIGPEDEGFKKSHLHDFSNVFFLGNKKPEELPAYIAHMDVLLNPQKLNDVTIGNYPRKIDEYLAMGKPVVATRTDTMSFFEDYVHLADEPEQYPEMVKKALKDNDDTVITSRIEFAQSHTWEQSVLKMYDIIEKL